MLIECGATADQQAENGVTPLQLAAYVGNKEAVSLLLRKGATVGLKDSLVSSWLQPLDITHVYAGTLQETIPVTHAHTHMEHSY